MAARSMTSPRMGWTQAIPRVPIPRAGRKFVVYLLLGVAALAGGWMWFRDSQLVAVDNVQIVGVKGPQSRAIRVALESAAAEMTTLNVRQGALRTAVAEYPTVKSVTATADFPHKLRIEVVSHVAVAAVVVGGHQVPVAEDGTILRGAYVRGLTPLNAKTPPVGDRLTDPFQLAAAHVLGLAPTQLRYRVTKIFMGPRGLTLHLKDGPSVAFGSGKRVRAKWSALATMLATPSADGAKLIDISIPERPAVPGFAPVTPVTDPATTAAPTTDQTIAPVTPTATTPAAPVTPQTTPQPTVQSTPEATGATIAP